MLKSKAQKSAEGGGNFGRSYKNEGVDKICSEAQVT